MGPPGNANLGDYVMTDRQLFETVLEPEAD
jgi:hypothetical protein